MALEFQSVKDGAWYDTTIVTEKIRGDIRLRVKFTNFSDEDDELFSAKDMKSLQDLEAFKSRVRLPSEQLQDTECPDVVKGLRVCAALLRIPDDCRFYDAYIEDVVHKKHRFVLGEELCTCNFIVEWIEGPKAGTLTAVALENMCRVQRITTSEEIDSLLASFVNAAMKKIESTRSKSVASSVENCGFDNDTLRGSKRYKAHPCQGVDKTAFKSRVQRRNELEDGVSGSREYTQAKNLKDFFLLNKKLKDMYEKFTRSRPPPPPGFGPSNSRSAPVHRAASLQSSDKQGNNGGY